MNAMRRSSGLMFLCFILLVAFMFLWAGISTSVQITASPHALAKHGDTALTAQDCFNGSGQTMTQKYTEPSSGRTMKFCNLHGSWFVSIDAEDGKNVTMFPRSMAKCLNDVLQYARNSGFLPPH